MWNALVGLAASMAVVMGQPGASEPTQSPPTPPSTTPAALSASATATVDPTTAIEAVLNDFHDAAGKADFDRYFSHWTDDSVFLGTDATERWVGEEFRDFARPHFDKGKGWSYTPRDRKVTLLGEAAFFDELLHNEKLGTCRGSGVLRRVDGQWKILQYNLSIPVPNDLAERTVQMIRDLDVTKGEGEDK